MTRDWIIPFAIANAAASVLPPSPAPVYGQPSPPHLAPADVALTPPASIKWSDACHLSVADGKIVLRSDLTTAQRTLSPDMAVDGIAGKTTVMISRRSFLVRNRQEMPGETMELTISASSSALSIEMQLTTPDEVRGVVLYQPGAGVSQRANRGVRLTLSGQETLTWEGTDLTDLRARAPHVVNRHLRPALLAAKADLLQIDPAVARQVLLGSDATDHVAATQPAATLPATTQPIDIDATVLAADGWPTSASVDPKLASEVRQLVKQLDSAPYRERAAAADRLGRMGPPAAAIVARMNRDNLSAEQNLALDLFLASVQPLAPEAAQQARRDPHFLLDCLYSPDPLILAMAADRLAQVTKQPAERFKAVIAMDPVQNPRAVATAIEDIRDGLVPPS